MGPRCKIPCCFGDKNRSIFRVPNNTIWRDKWLEAIRAVYPNLDYGENLLVCEKHFRKTDFTFSMAHGCKEYCQEGSVKRKRLKKGAVPHFDVLNLDLENDSMKTILTEQNQQRASTSDAGVVEPRGDRNGAASSTQRYSDLHKTNVCEVVSENMNEKLIKPEMDSEDTIIKEELDIEPTVLQYRFLPSPGLHKTDVCEVVSENMNEKLIKPEMGSEDTIIKEELDIEPTVLQYRFLPSPGLHKTDACEMVGAIDWSSVGEKSQRDEEARRTSEQLNKSKKCVTYRTGNKQYPDCKPSDLQTIETSQHGERSHSVCKSIHTKDRKLKFTCGLCDAEFRHLTSLSKHKSIHTSEKPHKCDLCNAKFRYSISLSMHQRIHTGKRPFKCDKYGANFKQKYHLICHKRIHTGEKPFGCDFCGAEFSQYRSLSAHKRLHTIEKRYNSKLRQSSVLSRHKRVHTGEKPFKCDTCSASFKQMNNLVIHKRMHTDEKPFGCDLCDAKFRHSYELIAHKRLCVSADEKITSFDIDAPKFEPSRFKKIIVYKRKQTGKKPFGSD